MKSTRSSLDWSKRIASTVVTTAIVVAPLIHTVGAQAQPPSHAPAWGYRRGNASQAQDRDWRDNDRRDYDDRNGSSASVERNLTGVVTRDLTGNRFELRTDSGRIVTVRLRQENEPRRLNRGDRVRVEGRFRPNGNFAATDVDILNNRDNNNRDERTLTGVVTRDTFGERFEMRTDSGRLVTVQLRQENEPRRLTRGDRVRVEGEFRSGSIFVANDLDILRDRNNGTVYGVSRVNFPATVLDVLSSTRLRVRGDNDRTYVVQSRTAFRRIDDGDRVRIIGESRNGIVTVQNVVLARNTDNR